MRRVCLIFYKTGTRWTPGLGSPEQPGFRAHADYLNGVDEKHRLVIGGPLNDYSQILLAIEAENADEARYVLRNDPWLLDDVLSIERIVPWDLLVDPR